MKYVVIFIVGVVAGFYCYVTGDPVDYVKAAKPKDIHKMMENASSDDIREASVHGYEQRAYKFGKLRTVIHADVATYKINEPVLLTKPIVYELREDGTIISKMSADYGQAEMSEGALDRVKVWGNLKVLRYTDDFGRNEP